MERDQAWRRGDGRRRSLVGEAGAQRMPQECDQVTGASGRASSLNADAGTVRRGATRRQPSRMRVHATWTPEAGSKTGSRTGSPTRPRETRSPRSRTTSPTGTEKQQKLRVTHLTERHRGKPETNNWIRPRGRPRRRPG